MALSSPKWGRRIYISRKKVTTNNGYGNRIKIVLSLYLTLDFVQMIREDIKLKHSEEGNLKNGIIKMKTE